MMNKKKEEEENVVLEKVDSIVRIRPICSCQCIWQSDSEYILKYMSSINTSYLLIEAHKTK